MNQEIKERKDVKEELTWDLTSIYKNEKELMIELDELLNKSKQLHQAYKGKLMDSQTINECLNQLQELEIIRDHAANYVELSLSVDFTNVSVQEIYRKTKSVLNQSSSLLSFIKSEILQQEEEVIENAAKESKENAHFLWDIKREKAHALTPETEEVLAALTATLDAPYEMYDQIKHADMTFPNFEVEGKEYPLGYVLWENEYEYETDTNLRRNAFLTFSDTLSKYKCATATAYQTQIQKEKTMAALRGFDSVIDYLLFPQKVDRKLYDRQIDLIMEQLAPHMRKYAKLLQKIHNLKEMTYPDLKIAVDPAYDPQVTIEESKKYIEEALAVLGEDYLDMIKTAYQDRWIDFAKNKGKSTGGFCSSPYGTNSFILLSWSEKMAEVFTLAHELGHAGHFKLCNEAQSIFDIDVSTYFVEAPSTMNELLMANHLLKSSDDKRFRRWVLSSMIGHTYYHNFVTHLLEAAYQRKVYEMIDAGGSVSADILCRIKREVLEQFWGEDVVIPKEAELTWMRQPHYYMGLYSYTYSAGLTIATQVSHRILKEGQPAIDDWRRVLKAGATKTPVELAKMAGVDITTDEPLIDTIKKIGTIVDEIIKLTEEIENESK